MSVNDLTNLGIEADMPDELRRVSAETEYTALLQHFDIAAATLNADIWQPAEQLRISGIVSANIARRIGGTRHALSAAQLTDLLTPRIQAAAETVARHDAMTPERRQSVSNALAQAIYDALPKEILHIIVEQEIGNAAPTYRAAYTVTEQEETRKFYEKLRSENDANDMVAGMAMFMAMHDATARPVGVAAAGGTAAVQSWEQKYITSDTSTVSRKNVAETIANFKTIQPIALPNKVPLASTRADIVTARTNIAAAVASLNTEVGNWDTQELTYNRAMATHEPAFASWEHVEKEWSDHRLAMQAAIAAGHAAPAPPAAPRTARPTIGAAQPVFAPVVLPGVFREAVRMADKAREKVAELEAADLVLQAALAEFNRRRRMIEGFVTMLQGMGIQNFAATFPLLNRLCAPGTGTPPGAPAFRPGLFTANFDFAGLAAEIERNFPNGLKSVDEYSKEVVEAGKKKPSGLDLSKSVIRSYVRTQRPSLSAGDIESVANYIVNRTKVDGILRSSVDQTMDNYLDVNDRTISDSLSNSWHGGLNRYSNTIDEIAAALRVPRRDGQQPNWQVASYEQVSAAYYSIKELVDGKGPADLRMTGKPQVAIDNMRTLARILSTKYAGQMEEKLVASLPEDQKKNVARSRARLSQAVQSALTGDTPDWAKSDVSRAHARADKRVAWFSRGAYDITTGAFKTAGSWIGTGATAGWSGGTSAVKHYGADAAKIAAFSLLGGPVLGIAAWYAMKQFEKPPSK